MPHAPTLKRERLAWAEQRRILAGIALQPHYPELGDTILISVTEINRSAELHRLAEVLAEAR